MAGDIDRAAELTIWPRARPARTAQSQRHVTLQAALNAAADALASDDVKTWIITESGDILSPGWIEARLQSEAGITSRTSA